MMMRLLTMRLEHVEVRSFDRYAKDRRVSRMTVMTVDKIFGHSQYLEKIFEENYCRS